MDKNVIKVSVPFSFKGATFRPGCTIDLDQEMRKTGLVPCLFTYLAEACGIDPYSYEYDVMVMGTLEFDDSTGFATDFIRNGQFDSEGFESEWRQRKLEEDLHEIASRCLGMAADDIPGLKDALMGAYVLGRRAPRDPF